MRFTFVPTLNALRELYTLPRDQSRFDAYIRLTVGDAQRTADVALPPLVSANPMAREHVLEFVEAWIALEAEEITGEVVREANVRLEAVLPERHVKLGLVAMDDLRGGWTNRYLSDAGFRFQLNDALEKTSWVTVPLWVSEPVSHMVLRRTALETMYRAAYVLCFGQPRTLEEMMRQEGCSGLFAEAEPALDAEELAYSRAVIAPHRGTLEYPVQFACLYGDEAAKSVGYAPLGLSGRAGFEVALADALESGLDPVRLLEKPGQER